MSTSFKPAYRSYRKPGELERRAAEGRARLAARREITAEEYRKARLEAQKAGLTRMVG